MKTIFKLTMAFAILTAFTLVSCSKDDDNSNTDNTTKTYTAKLNLSYDVSEELLKVGTITISYQGTDGKEVDEVLPSSTLSWTRELVYTNLPDTLGIAINCDVTNENNLIGSYTKLEHKISASLSLLCNDSVVATAEPWSDQLTVEDVTWTADNQEEAKDYVEGNFSGGVAWIVTTSGITKYLDSK